MSRLPHLLSALLLLAPLALAQDAAFNPAAMSLDDLMFHAARYGDTELKRERKEPAKAELMARKGDALRYLVARSHIQNIWFPLYAQELTGQMQAEEAVPVLLDALSDPQTEVKKTALYLLGFTSAPEYAVDILPFLGDPKLAGAAMRTLGKWRVSATTTRIIPFLQDADERRRVTAANALGDINDARAAPYLVHTLDDPYFTVRHAAARALARMGPQAEEALLRGIEKSTGRARRHIIMTLGEMRSRRAVRPLRRLLQDEDWGVRGDAARALRMIDPVASLDWLRGLERTETSPYVRAALPATL
ncbi:MAG: HEAT repeat domain-containing protein [Kiritimatiellae bacterium]|nr:HEAT repeat domain-containing protein [Kiritimatiellia bacterium]